MFGKLYQLLLNEYSDKVSNAYVKLMVNNEVSPKDVKIFDSTTISLFTDIFKAAGRNPLNGKKKGGVKVQAVISLASKVHLRLFIWERRAKMIKIFSDS